MKQMVEYQDAYDSYIFVADYHGLNQIHDGEVLRQNSVEIVKAYLAVGLDPEKVTLFRQSDVPLHTELAWIFNTITPMPMLELAHAYKDALASGKIASVGLFDYPVLMAADILLYDPEIVPVGSDQKQHVEIAREIARKFNNTFGQTFLEPKEMIRESVAVVPGTDGRKMSKSYRNVIPLFATPDETIKLCMSIVTDSRGASDPKDPGTCNVFALHRLFQTAEELSDLEGRYRAGTISYKESKELLAEHVNRSFAPLRAKKMELDNDPGYIARVLANGKERAYARAATKMQHVREKCGFATT